MGHGDHWKAILGETGSIEEIVCKMIEQGKRMPAIEEQKEARDAHQPARVFYGIEYGAAALGGLAVIEQDTIKQAHILITAYPFLREGAPHDLEILAINDDPEYCEATLHGIDRDGAELTFFAPLYVNDSHILEVGDKYTFSMAAIAYNLTRVEDTELIITEGPSIEMERERVLKEDPDADVSQINSVKFHVGELRSLLPHEDEPGDAGFQTVVEDVAYFHFDNIEICRMLVTFNLGDDRKVALNLYASENVLMGYRPQIGDPIRGTLWLQGYVLYKIEDPESWAARDRKDSTIERLQRAFAADEYLSDLPVGVKALGSSMAYSGLELTSYGNYGQSPDVPAFLVEHQGKAINVWVRSYVDGQEPAHSFTDEEKKDFSEISRARGQQGVCVVVVCKDVGSGYTFTILGLEELEALTGRLLMTEYRRKDSKEKDKA